MQIRHILLIHPSRAVRGLITKLILSEFGDVRIVEADTAQKALEHVKTKCFNVVLVTALPIDLSLDDLKSRVARIEVNAITPFIILTENESENGSDDMILRRDFRFIVPIRLRPSELIDTINQACDPRTYRQHERYHFPDAKALISGSGWESEATLINISRGGVLIELHTRTPEMLLRRDLRLDLRVPLKNSDHLSVPDLKGRIAAMNVIAWHSDNSPETLRTTIIFGELSESTRTALEKLLGMGYSAAAGSGRE